MTFGQLFITELLTKFIKFQCFYPIIEKNSPRRYVSHLPRSVRLQQFGCLGGILFRDFGDVTVAHLCQKRIFAQFANKHETVVPFLQQNTIYPIITTVGALRKFVIIKGLCIPNGARHIFYTRCDVADTYMTQSEQ